MGEENKSTACDMRHSAACGTCDDMRHSAPSGGRQTSNCSGATLPKRDTPTTASAPPANKFIYGFIQCSLPSTALHYTMVLRFIEGNAHRRVCAPPPPRHPAPRTPRCLTQAPPRSHTHKHRPTLHPSLPPCTSRSAASAADSGSAEQPGRRAGRERDVAGAAGGAVDPSTHCPCAAAQRRRRRRRKSAPPRAGAPGRRA